MCRNTLDFELLRNYLNNDFERYIREWFPNAYRLNDSTYRTGDFNDSKVKRGDGSLSFNMRDKYAKDFSTDETAGDIISIYAKRFCNGNNGKAFKEIVERYNLEYLFENYNNNFCKNNSSLDGGLLRYARNDVTTADSSLDGGLPRRSTPRNDVTTGSVKKYTSADREKDNKIKNILSKIEHYKLGDPVDLYLKSRGITKYSPDTYIVNTDKMAVLVNLCNKTLTNTKKEFEETGKLYRRTDSVAGIQEIFLTREGKKRDSSATPSKIQRSYFNNTISGNPVRLSEKGDNNGYIYITEGVENGLSIQEHINNEVWCALSIVNIPTLPFENNKVYVFVLDNDYKKETKTKVSETLKEKLKALDINYRIEYELNPPLTSSASPLRMGVAK